MAKKRVKKENKEEGGIVSALKDFSTGFLLGALKNTYTEFIETLQGYAYKTQERILEIFSLFIVMLCGLIFLLIGLVFLINEYVKLSWGWSFLIMGITLILISYLLKIQIIKKK